MLGAALHFLVSCQLGRYAYFALGRVCFLRTGDVQSVKVLETRAFGKTLVTDGKTQISAFDEAVYHESLVHPVMFYCALRNSSMSSSSKLSSSSSSPSSSPTPRSVLIGGGGEHANESNNKDNQGPLNMEADDAIICDENGMCASSLAPVASDSAAATSGPAAVPALSADMADRIISYLL